MTDEIRPPPGNEIYVDLIGGPGALRSLTAILGFLLVLEKSEIKGLRNIFGVSGGSLPLVLIAAGYTTREVVNYALDIRFADFVDLGSSHYSVVASHLARGRRRQQLPTKGVYNTSKLGREIERLVGERTSGWPKRFWTMALEGTVKGTNGRSSKELPQILFNAQGIFRRYKDGAVEQISAEPAPIGLAIRATCAVPLFLEPVKVTTPMGETLVLFDGALSWEGAIPLGVVDHIAPNVDQQVIIDVGDEPGALKRTLSRAIKIVCGGQCVANYNTRAIAKDRGRILLYPSIMAVRSFDFMASRDTKWLAIAEGFLASVYALEKRGLLIGQNLVEAREICATMFEIASGAAKSSPGEVSRQIERLLVDKGWL